MLHATAVGLPEWFYPNVTHNVRTCAVRPLSGLWDVKESRTKTFARPSTAAIRSHAFCGFRLVPPTNLTFIPRRDKRPVFRPVETNKSLRRPNRTRVNHARDWDGQRGPDRADSRVWHTFGEFVSVGNLLGLYFSNSSRQRRALLL